MLAPFPITSLIQPITSQLAANDDLSPTKYMLSHPCGRRGLTVKLTRPFSFVKPRDRSLRTKTIESSRSGSSSEAIKYRGGI